MASGVPSFKVILCGEYGVGKSSIFRRFVDNSFSTYEDTVSKIGLDHLAKRYVIYPGCEVELVLWDTAGIERFATLSSSYFHSASVALVCYALDSPDSFGCVAQHVLEAVEQTRTARIFLCGTKKDLDASGIFSVAADIETLREQLDCVISGMFTVSSKTGEGVAEMFERIAQIVHRQVDERFDPAKIRISMVATDDGALEPAEQKRCC